MYAPVGIGMELQAIECSDWLLLFSDELDSCGGVVPTKQEIGEN